MNVFFFYLGTSPPLARPPPSEGFGGCSAGLRDLCIGARDAKLLKDGGGHIGIARHKLMRRQLCPRPYPCPEHPSTRRRCADDDSHHFILALDFVHVDES